MSAHSPGPWRTGRKVGRTVYDANDRLIGVMDTPALATLAASWHELLAALKIALRGARDGWGHRGGKGCATCDDVAAAEALIARIEGDAAPTPEAP